MSSAWRFAPSRRNWTPATAVLSEALALTVMVFATVAPFVGAVRETVGGVVSEEAPELLNTARLRIQALLAD